MGGGINPVVGVLNFKEDNFSKKQVKLSGGAAFYKDKLVGFLNEKETRGYRWVKGDIESGALSLPSPVDAGRFETVEVTKAKAKIKPNIKGDTISFTISVNGKGNIVEEESSTPLENNAKKLEHMKKVGGKMNRLVETEIKAAVAKAQNEFHSDIFGFGRALNIEDPKTWNKVKEDWNERFTKVPYTVKVHFSIKSTELTRGPFQSTD
jgi:spore germination protein KC